MTTIDLERIRSAADTILGPICAEVGRVMWQAPNEDMIALLHEHGVEIPAGAFGALYDATDTLSPPVPPVLDQGEARKSLSAGTEALKELGWNFEPRRDGITITHKDGTGVFVPIALEGSISSYVLFRLVRDLTSTTDIQPRDFRAPTLTAAPDTGAVHQLRISLRDWKGEWHDCTAEDLVKVNSVAGIEARTLYTTPLPDTSAAPQGAGNGPAPKYWREAMQQFDDINDAEADWVEQRANELAAAKSL